MAKVHVHIMLDRDLARALRLRAFDEGKTISEVVEEALRAYLGGGG